MIVDVVPFIFHAYFYVKQTFIVSQESGKMRCKIVDYSDTLTFCHLVSMTKKGLITNGVNEFWMLYAFV